MGILRRIEIIDPDHWSVWGARLPDCCFCCHKKLFLPAVYWHGCGKTKDEEHQIWLHPECAVKFGQNMMTDGNDLLSGKA